MSHPTNEQRETARKILAERGGMLLDDYDGYESDMLAIAHALAAEADKEREECETACLNEMLHGEPDNDDDRAYNRGVRDCVVAILARNEADRGK